MPKMMPAFPERLFLYGRGPTLRRSGRHLQLQEWWDAWEREQDRAPRRAGRAKSGPGSDDIFRDLYSKPVQEPWKIIRRARRDWPASQHSVIYLRLRAS